MVEVQFEVKALNKTAQIIFFSSDVISRYFEFKVEIPPYYLDHSS